MAIEEVSSILNSLPLPQLNLADRPPSLPSLDGSTLMRFALGGLWRAEGRFAMAVEYLMQQQYRLAVAGHIEDVEYGISLREHSVYVADTLADAEDEVKKSSAWLDGLDEYVVALAVALANDSMRPAPPFGAGKIPINLKLTAFTVTQWSSQGLLYVASTLRRLLGLGNNTHALLHALAKDKKQMTLHDVG